MAKKNLGNADLVSSISLTDNIFVEVGGSVRRLSASSIPAPSTEDQQAYGIQRDKTSSDPTWTRIGNLSLHKTLPIQSLMRGCLLNDDGSVREYLPYDTWVNSITDGSRGQVMVEVPTHYRKFTEEGNIQTAMFSLYPLAGYTEVPKFYFGAYEAALERSTLKLSSVKNTSEDYRGGNNTADYDGTYCSLLGMPASAISFTNFRTYARNRGSAGKNGCGWNGHVYSLYRNIVWLYVLEYANNNMQADYTSELTAEGYKQGGLGSGVSGLSSSRWSDYNSSNPFIPCGYTDSLGNGTGVVAFEMPEEYGTTLTVYVPRYRGIELIATHCNKSCDGIMVVVNPDEEDGGTGLSPIYVCEDPAKFSSTAYDDYYLVGNLPRVSDYMTRIHFGVNGEIVAMEADGGSSTTYFCDNSNGSASVTAVTLRGVLCGGSATFGSSAGLFCAHATNAFSSASTARVSRLCFIPE